MHYRGPYQPQDQRFIGLFGLPFLGGLAGGLLGTALYSQRPYYYYPPPPVYPRPCCPPGYGYPY